MRYYDGKIIFEKCDMDYIAKHSLEEAIKTAEKFKDLPLLMDTKQLAHFFCMDKDDMFKMIKSCDSMYRSVSIPKKRGGHRKIDIPESSLCFAQQCILYRILNEIQISKYATAYHKGARIKDNALPHTNKKYLLKIDITDFFGSIKAGSINKKVFAPIYPKQTAYFLSLLCTKDGKLVQGSPSSPAISNIVMKHFDEAFGHWCEKRNLSYTRYCDDITVSGNTPLYTAYKKASKWLGNMGFKLNESKTHFVTNASNQRVTGLTVNEKVSVPKEYKRRLRQELYYVDRFGFNSAAKYKKYKDKNRYYYNLLGRLNYVLSIEPDNIYFLKAKEKLTQQNIVVFFPFM